MCLATLQQELADEEVEKQKLTMVLQTAAHSKYDKAAKKYQECIKLIEQIKLDIETYEMA